MGVQEGLSGRNPWSSFGLWKALQSPFDFQFKSTIRRTRMGFRIRNRKTAHTPLLLPHQQWQRHLLRPHNDKRGPQDEPAPHTITQECDGRGQTVVKTHNNLTVDPLQRKQRRAFSHHKGHVEDVIRQWRSRFSFLKPDALHKAENIYMFGTAFQVGSHYSPWWGGQIHHILMSLFRVKTGLNSS